MKKALKIAIEYLNDWPEDEWWDIGDHFDLNVSLIYAQGVKICYACIYRVDDAGIILTDDWVRILEYIPVEGQYVGNEANKRWSLTEEEKNK